MMTVSVAKVELCSSSKWLKMSKKPTHEKLTHVLFSEKEKVT